MAVCVWLLPLLLQMLLPQAGAQFTELITPVSTADEFVAAFERRCSNRDSTAPGPRHALPSRAILIQLGKDTQTRQRCHSLPSRAFG